MLLIPDFGAAIIVLLELHAIELRVVVHNPRPAIDANNRNYPVVLVGEGVDFLGPRVQTILAGDNQERGHLRGGHLALECRLLQGGQQFLRVQVLRGLAVRSG